MNEYAVLCHNCRQLMNKDSQKCPNCGAKNFRVFHFFDQHKKMNVSSLLVGCNVGIFILSLLITSKYSEFSPFGFLHFFSPSSAFLQILGCADPGRFFQGSYWVLISSAFLHAGILHITFNMIWLKELYPINEKVFGMLGTFFIYIFSGVGGSLCAVIFGDSPVVGASGAIFGLLTAYIASAQYSQDLWHRFFSKRYLKIGLIVLVIGFLTPGVSNLAHLGGAFFGYVAGKLFAFYRPGLLIRGFLGGLAVFCTFSSFLFSFYNLFSHLF